MTRTGVAARSDGLFPAAVIVSRADAELLKAGGGPKCCTLEIR